MAVEFKAAVAMHWFGVDYAAGDTVDTTSYGPEDLARLVKHAPVYAVETGGPLVGLLSAMPANGAVPNGSSYLATDQNGGTAYLMVSGAWVQIAAGVNTASGQIIAGPVQMTGASSFDVKAVGSTVTDVTGMTINVPASSRPVLLRHKWEVQANSGTSVAASVLRIIAHITDNSNAIIASGGVTFVQVTNVAVVFQGQIKLEAYLPAPVAAATYKLRAQLSSAAPTNWSTALLFPNNGNGGGNGADNFYAQAV